jgi:hypothetical protein
MIIGFSVTMSIVEETIRESPYLPKEAKSMRERYILVAAIDIMIIDGVWNICVVEPRRRSIACPHEYQTKDVRGSWALVDLPD